MLHVLVWVALLGIASAWTSPPFTLPCKTLWGRHKLRSAGQSEADDVELMESAIYEVLPEEAGQRIDSFLASRETASNSNSRSFYGSLCKAGMVQLLGDAPVKKSHRVSAGERFEVVMGDIFSITHPLEPQDIELDILVEDDELLAVHKPDGMVVHPAPGNWDKTFANALLWRLQEQGIDAEELKGVVSGAGMRPGIVHRLDKGTTGEEREIDVPIGRHPVYRQRMMAVTDIQPEVKARHALTSLKRCAYDGKLSVVELEIQTGRTHQIRVHMKQIRTPILGDSVYGSRDWNRRVKGLTRPLLHAYSLDFVHPTTGEDMSVKAPLPRDLADAITRIYPTAKQEHPDWFGPGSLPGSEAGEVEAGDVPSLAEEPAPVASAVGDGHDWF